MKLRAPFPWFGGKSRAASLVWEGLGDVPNYVEPFAGSLAVLLGRPTEARTETVNDLDCYVANFWRAIARDPEGVAEHADWPVNEADLHARHRWLVGRKKFRERMRSSPDFFDVRIAGWWVWGLSCWIGGGWCSATEDGPRLGEGSPGGMRQPERIPEVAASGTGHTIRRGVVAIGESGRAGETWNVRPDVTSRGRGAHKLSLGGNGHGVGVHRNRRRALVAEFENLAERLRAVRVCCGDWKRVLTPSVTTGHGLTGIVLDPPYAQDERSSKLYACESSVSEAVRAWALEHQGDPLMRIVLCGYEGEHEMPDTWRVVEWTASGGYGRGEKGAANRFRERLWFSPACLEPRQGSLFG